MLVLAGASSASASTFFVATTGNNANDCTSSATPCLTIAGAIAKARAAPDTATINVAAGTYTEDVALTSPADDGTAIVGAGSGAGGTTIQGVNGNPAIALGSASTSNALSHLAVVNSPGGNDNGVSIETAATLTDVAIDMHNAGSGTGLAVSGRPAVVFDSGSVTMANGTSGSAVQGGIGGLTVRASTVTLANGASGTAISGSLGPLVVSATTIGVGNSGSTAIAGSLGGTTVTDTTVNQGATGATAGIVGAPGELTLKNDTVTMSNATNSGGAVEGIQATTTADNLTVSGSWTGPGFFGLGVSVVRDSHITAPSGVAGEFIDGGSAGRSALVQRSVLRQGSSTGIGILALDADLTLDSSEVLGGQFGVDLIHSSGKVRTATIAGSTIDAGTPGSRDALPGSSAVVGNVSGSNSSTLNVLVQGSILVDSQTATLAGSNSLTISCSDSDAPDQTQAADATHGAINCANGSNGNTQTDPLTSLFANPAASPPDYGPVPSSPAIDAVPASGISLPAGTTPSATDLAGNPRTVDGNGDCVATRDKGALELQGHAGTVPAPAISSPATGVAGAPIAFGGSAPNVPAGTALSFAWTFSDAATATGAAVSHAFAAPGAATATLTASSGGSCSASTTAQLTILPIAPVLTVDNISKLRLTPQTFAAASSGASVAARKGATVSYVGTQPAKTTFTVQRRVVGRKVAGHCVKATKGNVRKRPCARYVTVGSFTHNDAAAGAVRFRFTGRVSGHKLRPGSYRLRAVARNAAGTGAPAVAKFTIKR